MLAEETEIWVESVWESMSEQLRKKVVVAVDTGLMHAKEIDELPDSVIRALSGDLLDEARKFSWANGVLKEIPLGKHDIRSDGSNGLANFRVTSPLSNYVLIRVLL